MQSWAQTVGMKTKEVTMRDNSKGKKSIPIRATLPYICKELCY